MLRRESSTFAGSYSPGFRRGDQVNQFLERGNSHTDRNSVFSGFHRAASLSRKAIGQPGHVTSRGGSISTRPSVALATTRSGMLGCRHLRMSGELPLCLLHLG